MNPAPLHAEPVISFIAGRGLTVTTTSKSAPGQLPDVGVTVYVAFSAPLVVLVRVPIMLPPEPPAPPESPAGTEGAVQL